MKFFRKKKYNFLKVRIYQKDGHMTEYVFPRKDYNMQSIQFPQGREAVEILMWTE